MSDFQLKFSPRSTVEKYGLVQKRNTFNKISESMLVQVRGKKDKHGKLYHVIFSLCSSTLNYRIPQICIHDQKFSLLWLYMYVTEACSCFFSFLALKCCIQWYIKVIKASCLLTFSSWSHIFFFSSANGFAQQHHSSLFKNVKVKCVVLATKNAQKIPRCEEQHVCPKHICFSAISITLFLITDITFQVHCGYCNEVSTSWVDCRLQKSFKCCIRFTLNILYWLGFICFYRRLNTHYSNV